MSDTPFVHLHLHSQYSLLDGAIKIGDLVKRAKEQRMPALAITDHGNMFGAVEFYLAAKAADVKPIFGCEVYVATASRFAKSNARTSSDASHHLVLLAENLEGYRNLCRLVSAGYREGFYYKPRVDWTLLQECNQGLIALTACLGGEIPTLIEQGKMDDARRRCAEMSEIFDNERFYLELQENLIPEQTRVNRGLKEIARDLGLPLVATNDCHYLTRDQAHAHEVLLCIQTGKTMDDPTRMRFPNDEFYVKTPQEMAALFEDVPEAISNTLRIADRCEVDLDLKTYHFPQYEKPAEKSLEDVLREDSRRGLDERLAEIRKVRPVSAEDEKVYRERLETELDCINSMGFPGYFLIVADFINWAKDQNIPVGPGRGSAAGSLVAYAIRITDIDPIPYNLLFERFLNPERVSMPDIDVDFCIRGREDVIEYVRQKYGAANVAQIITFGTMAAKGVIRDVGRAMGLPYGEVDKIAKLVPGVLNITLGEALKQEPKLRDLVDKDAKVKQLFNTALALEGLTRHASTHAAGVVVTPNDLTEYLPLYVDPKAGGQVTQFSMNYVEKIGLVKFDFLGLKTLTVIDNAVRLIRAGKNPDFDLNLIGDDDAKTYELLSRGETTGVFQLESSGMKELLVKLKPSCFEDIVAVCALYRPGPLGSGMVDDFIQRKHGKKKITYDFPQLEPILKDTYGVIVYQEQVMLIAQVLANYSLGGADLLRRAMGKKKVEEMAKEREKFLAGARDNNLDAKKAGAVFDLMEMFAAYGFNKSHSAAYALVAYHTAYLKAHYPVEFMAALLTEDMENTDKVVKNIAEVRSMGIEVLPPDINASERSFTVHDNAIRFGLGAVKGVGGAALEVITEVRRETPFSSLHDFCERVTLQKVNKKVIEALIKCGAFDSLGGRRAQFMAALEDAMEAGQSLQRERALGQESLFGMEEIVSAGGNGHGKLPDVEEWPEKVLLSFEKEALGFFITGHPLARYRDTIKRFATCDAAALGERSDKEEVKVCGIVSAVKELTTKKGDRMAFATLEDLSGLVEMVLFPEVYQASSDLIKGEEPILVSGSLDVGEETCKLMVAEVISLRDVQERQTKNVHFRLSSPGLDEEHLRGLKNILKQFPGRCGSFIHVVVPNECEAVVGLPDILNVAASDELMEATEKLFGYQVVTFE
ncbi:DNA polymerase III, alpha subunit [Geoalkalibacter ferrihydriticus]|uniref:DNA polymerase III subunit alpha n=2 Tax=Geoalkalibacter ferrihydriticus TaxID=392333 RepID=A0A0C2HSK0_9BACT|nr:DNA polymerase III subunit alpha [Geoalkalibacter ferrihydriticus]KIH75732.1 DNA polymerase III subunit alpha [Geoalkalibacter ferrihydriticus DSM 17813]SDM62586.1 DNA polymerase III, alpha subunit [Geoalkalibacter ferrihydriticus]